MKKRVLVVDVGGTNLKVSVGLGSPPRKIPSGPEMTASGMVKEVFAIIDGRDFDVVTLGYPGPVKNGKPLREPKNLAAGWVEFDYRKAFGKPIIIINDAALQALGNYTSGRLLFLGLGTGLGSALVADGLPIPLELAHLPYRNGKTFEDYVGLRGLKRLGRRKWTRHVTRAVGLLRDAFQADVVVLGGGQTRKLVKLPPDVKQGDNMMAIVGGVRLWKTEVG